MDNNLPKKTEDELSPLRDAEVPTDLRTGADKSPSPRRPIGLYRPGLTSPERLDKTTIGREEMLRDLLEKLARSTEKKSHQHYVFVGARGVGKTHLLSLLVHRIKSSSELRDRFTVVRFAEETHRLLSFADFLLRICEILAQSNDNDEWQRLYAQLAEEEDDQRIIETLEPRLNSWREDTGRILLVLLENLDEVLTRQIKNAQDLHRLRSFLMTSPSCILVATSPLTFPGLTDVRAPFYDFFDIQVLDNLTRQQTVDAIRLNLEYDDRQDLLNRFDELSPKIKALHEMTGGNPRLVMMHYTLIADEDIQEVKRQFEELLDRISPFYQDRIRELPPQERAVLETMALIRTEPKTPALIAARLRKSPQQTSTLLQRLTKSGYLVVMGHPNDKRSKIYRIKEGFFDLWLSMNESRKQRQRLPALSQFFEVWYGRKEREQKRRAIVDRLLAGDADATDTEHCTATLDSLSDAGPAEEKVLAKTRLAAVMQQTGHGHEVAGYLDEVNTLKPGGIVQWLTNRRDLWAEDARGIDPIEQVEEMIACWELQRTGHLEEFASRLMKVGRSLSDHGLHAALADLFLSCAGELADPEAKIRLFLQAAKSQQMMGDLPNALVTLEKALQQAIDAGHRKFEGTTLNNISQVYDARGDYDQALKYLEQSLAICREIGDRAVEGATLNNISQVYHARGDYDQALKYLEQSLAIQRDIGDRYGEGATLSNISQVYKAREDYDQALKYLEQALAIQREIGDRDGEGATLNNISTVRYTWGDYDQALKYLEPSLALQREIGNRAGLCASLFNLGAIQWDQQDTEAAMATWLTVYQTAKEIQLADALHSLENRAREMGHENGLAFWESLLEEAGGQ